MFGLLNVGRVIGALFATTAVMLGAYAAHAITDPLAAMAVDKAANYQLIHAIALIVATFLQGRIALISRLCFTVGMVLFCGSIEVKYLLHLNDLSKFAPTGGVLLMVAWLALGLCGATKYPK